MPIEKSDLLQGTLDMLILKIVALGPVHGYGISLRIRQISKEVLQVQQGSLYPLFIASKSADGSKLNGATLKKAGRPSSTNFRQRPQAIGKRRVELESSSRCGGQHSTNRQ